MTIKLSGFDELNAKLKTLGPRVARKVGNVAVKKAAQVIVDEAKVLVPVLTGELEDSITAVVARTRPEDEVKVQIGFKKTASWRAHFTEFGTVHSPPQPFMRPALDMKAEDALAVMGEELWSGIEKEAAKKG